MTDDWRDLALCRGEDPELWALGNSREMYQEAHRICRRCPVREPCFKDGIASHAVGVIQGGRDFGSKGAWQKFERKPCGTNAAYQSHKNRREKPCLQCSVARSAYVLERKARLSSQNSLSRSGLRPSSPRSHSGVT